MCFSAKNRLGSLNFSTKYLGKLSGKSRGVNLSKSTSINLRRTFASILLLLSFSVLGYTGANVAAALVFSGVTSSSSGCAIFMRLPKGAGGICKRPIYRLGCLTIQSSVQVHQLF